MTAAGARLAIFLPGLHGGGAERIALNLADAVAGRGHAVDLVLSRAVGPLLSQVPRRVRLVDLGASRALTSLPALARYLRRERPDAMLSVLNRANLVALCARSLTGVPARLVVSEHNTLSRWAKKSWSPRVRLTPWLARCSYRWATAVVAVSQGVADDLVEVWRIPRERVQVIYNPVVTRELEEKAAAPLTHPWFRPGEPPVILNVGSLTAQKDHATLLRAVALVRRNRPARLVILGEGSERPALEALARELGIRDDVELPGFVENPYAYMSRAALFVLSSRWEGLPTVLIEALYCGARLVSTDCPSGPREILRQGHLGTLVPVGRPEALAAAIERALDEAPPRRTAECWEPYDSEAVVRRYLDLLLGPASAARDAASS